MDRKTGYFKGLSRKDYIRKAYEIICSEGAGAVSIRRLAADMNCSSTSLYRYFSGRDELLYYSHLPILRKYIDSVRRREKKWRNIWEAYCGIWQCFAEEAFHNADAYNLLFFDNANLNLEYAIKEYYRMFPEDFGDVSSVFKEMFQISDFHERDLFLCRKCVDRGLISEAGGRKLSRMCCLLLEGHIKGILDRRPDEAAITKQIEVYSEDVESLVCWLADDLDGFRSEKDRKVKSGVECYRDNM